MAKQTATAPQTAPPKFDLPKFEIAERMAQHGTVQDLRESEVCDLLDPKLFPEPMATTWVNTEEPGRFHHVVNTLGWVPVRPEWLKAGTMSGAWSTSPEGYLTRGEKGADIACMMPKRYDVERMRKLAVARSERARDVSGLKTKIAERQAQDGDQRGAERTMRARMHVTALNETKGEMPGPSMEDAALNPAEQD